MTYGELYEFCKSLKDDQMDMDVVVYITDEDATFAASGVGITGADDNVSEPAGGVLPNDHPFLIVEI
jgi:hypothetical protein